LLLLPEEVVARRSQSFLLDALILYPAILVTL